MSCFVMQCDQTITGRNFEYDEALEIIQFEEYSEDIDFDEIRRYDIKKKIGDVDQKVNLRKGRMNEGPQNGNFFEKRRKRKRFKPGFDLEHIEKEKKKQGQNPRRSGGLFGMANSPLGTGAQAAGSLGIGMFGMAMMLPNLGFQASGTAGGSLPVGSIAGGGLPTNAAIQTLSLSLALVPLGLIAVVVFPPFASPRTLPAVAVIFSEPRNMGSPVPISKRDVHRLYNKITKHNIRTQREVFPTYSEVTQALRNTNSRKRSGLTRAWNILQRFRVWLAKRMYQRLPKPMKRIVKKIERIESILHKKMVCLKPRLERRYGRLVYPEGLTVKALVEKKQHFFENLKSGDPDDDHVEFIEDCFKDMKRPKFGWSVKVTLTENEPCDLNLENPELNTCFSTLNHNNDTVNPFNINNAQRRQTLEQFRSAAPPDCRIIYICDANNQVEATDLRNNDNTSIPTTSPTISSTLSPTPSPTLSPTLSPMPSPSTSPPSTLSPKSSTTSSPTMSTTLSTTQSPTPLNTLPLTHLPHIYSYHVPKSNWYYTNFKPV